MCLDPPEEVAGLVVVQELRVVVEPLVAGPPKLEPLKASPAVAPALLPHDEEEEEEARPLPALSLTSGAVGGDRWSLMTPAEAPPSTLDPSEQHRLVAPSERPPEVGRAFSSQERCVLFPNQGPSLVQGTPSP